MLTPLLILSQATAPAPPPPAPAPQVTVPWVTLDTIFWFTVFSIFILTIVSALLRRLSKDKALKLFHEYHITFFSDRRITLWGDCLVSSQGVELLFDQAFTTRRKLIKSSALIYDDELTPMVCMTRSIHGLNQEELRDRTNQIHETFNPSALRRSKRWFRNLLNTMRDAITRTMGLVLGRMASVPGAMVGTISGDITNLTGNVVNLAANAYEPLLERYIGQPVVLEMLVPLNPPPPLPFGAPPPPPGPTQTIEFPGYLVDYTQRFVAVFNVDHTPVEEIQITLIPGQPPTPDVPDLKITLETADTIIKCEGKDAFVLRQISQGSQVSDLGIALVPGTGVILGALLEPAILKVERTRHIDIIVPRTRARIRFGSLPPRKGGRRNWLGISPMLEQRVHALRENVHSLFNGSDRAEK